MLNIEDPRSVKAFALFNLGFRPFFILAGLFAALSMLLWTAIYLQNMALLPAQLSAMQWHGHEMVFGYSIAVISGFLLTAIKNWTGQQTLQGKWLFTLCLLWVVARVLPFINFDSAMVWTAIVDMLFMTGLTVALLSPIIKVRQWNQLAVVLKVALMLISNLLFYLGLLGILPIEAVHWGLYSGLYLVISLIMLMGRRVIPFFIEKGVDEDVQIRNWKWLDLSSLFLFLAFLVVEVFLHLATLSALLAGLLFVLHAIRLWGWYAKGIWAKPLLWVLYIGYGFIVLGFGLHAIANWLSISPWIPLHAFATGGIGIITAGMMSRVALGHTGRNVFEPPKILVFVFGLLVGAAVIRVIFPILLPDLYLWWIGTAQALWIAGFMLFVFIYTPILVKARVDGRPG